MEPTDRDLTDAPGWRAVTAALTGVYPDQAPRRTLAADLPGDGVSALDVYVDGDTWCYVTLGLSDRFVPRAEPGELAAGHGFELTLRVPRAGRDTPPDWAVGALCGLADYAVASGRRYPVGHRVLPGTFITDVPDSAIAALALTQDPRLGTVTGVEGPVPVLTVVGVTLAEHERMQATSTLTVLAELAADPAVGPLLVTDPARARRDAAPAPRRRGPFGWVSRR